MTLCPEEHVQAMFSGTIFIAIKLQTERGKSQLSGAMESDSVIPGVGEGMSSLESSCIKRPDSEWKMLSESVSVEVRDTVENHRCYPNREHFESF